MTMRTWGIAAAIAVAALPAQPLLAQSASSISAQDKAQGAEAHPQLLREYGGAYVGPQADYVRRVGQKIAVQSGLSNAQSDFTVSLLNSPVDNAFAIPGGYVYVTRNLLALMNDEAELASVMGHEVGHVAARHSRARNNTSTAVGIGTSLLGALLGNSALGQLATRGVGTVAQLGVLSYSRGQETQADSLGVQYLVKAGYDPLAASSMLGDLAAQNTLDARIGGKSGGTPTIFSTHPDPLGRVARTRQEATATGFTKGVRNRDAFLAAIDGMIYGDDPAQGIVDGQTFRHPGLKLAFTAPTGFAMANGTDAVTMTGQGGQASFSGGAYTGDLDTYIRSVFKALAPNSNLDAAAARRFQVGGMDAASATVGATTQSGPVDVTVVAYAAEAKAAYHFVLITAQGSGIGPFQSLVNSVRRLSASESAAIKPRRIKVVTVGRTDTVATLAARMAYPAMQAERFRVLNGLAADAVVRPGQKVKLVVIG
ncbi:M48 family metalloprotease [Sphingomonas sp. SUN039]|uniref:M48 family metalloprotease n=1 Tax=Sphingomonas sp. SUN039 TaxID=2937787 RepID=UPI002164991D|nr:M48 family metalloprotease [Sphingomonas sp. SUN039]UVO53456.1 M48 family metalloprotease [Sphingomonas sp. SUN039]